MSIDEKIEMLQTSLKKTEEELREAHVEKNSATVAAIMAIVHEVPWDLSGMVFGAPCLKLDDKKESPTSKKIRELWKHGYHDYLETNELEIRFDDWEYTIYAKPANAGASSLIKLAEKYKIKIFDTVSEDIAKHEKDIKKLQKVKDAIEHLFI